MIKRKHVIFLVRWITAGLAAAFVVLIFNPELLPGNRSVIEIREVSVPTGNTGATADSRPVSYAEAVRSAAPAVVNIHTAKVVTTESHPLFRDPFFRQFFGDRFPMQRKHLQTSLGSGVVVSTQGYVLTNNHVIEGADEIQVMLADGSSGSAEVVGVDPDTDLAILKTGMRDLPAITMGDSESLEVGDIVLAIGNPFGVGQTVTQGIVSATGRNQLGINTFENFIQTDAAINPGNSGGALINARGELIAINTAIFSRTGGSQGIGFAIPVSLAKGVMKQIIESGHVVRGWLGIEARDLTPRLRRTLGIDTPGGMLIVGVLKGGPADDANLLPGDVLLAFDKGVVNSARDAMTRIAALPPGTWTDIGGVRDGKSFVTRARVAERPLNSRDLR